MLSKSVRIPPRARRFTTCRVAAVDVVATGREADGGQPVTVKPPIAYRDFTIDPAALELRRGGARIPLTPQAVRLLLILVERRGERGGAAVPGHGG